MFIFCSCNETTEEATEEMSFEYFQGNVTHLCYSAVHRDGANAFDEYSLCCVPCDSLKNVTVHIFNEKK